MEAIKDIEKIDDTDTGSNGENEELENTNQRIEDKGAQGFVVDDDSKASWCLRKIKKMKKKLNDNEKLADELISKIEEEIRDIEDWRDSENEKIQNNIDFLKNKLRGYADSLKEQDPDLKTYSLPHGDLKFRKQRPKWKYNENKLLDFVEHNFDEALKIKKKVSKRTLKRNAEVAGNNAVLTKTGQVIEGVTIVNRPEKFKINVNN